MSVKIYNGYRIETSNAAKLQNIFGEVEKLCLENAKEELAIEFSEMLYMMRDFQIYNLDWKSIPSLYSISDKVKELNNDKFEYSIFQYYWKLLLEVDKQLKMPYARREPSYDHNIVFGLVCHNKFTLVNVLSEKAKKHGEILLKVCENQKIRCREYAYYDNTDQPEDISKRSWTVRGKNWLSFKGGYSSLSFERNVSCASIFLDFDSETDTLPVYDFEKRVEIISMILAKKDKKWDNELKKLFDTHKDKIYTLMKEVGKIEKQIKKTTKYVEIEKSVRSKLPKTYDNKDFS